MRMKLLGVVLCGLGLGALSLPAEAAEAGLPALTVKKMGQLFIGGEEVPYPAGRGGVPDEFGTQWRGFSTVFYILPNNQKSKVPVVLIPGAGLSCDMYMSTPDDREGWLQIFARLGHPSYCLSITPRAASRIWPENINACIRIAKVQAQEGDQEKCDALNIGRGGTALSLTSKQGPLNIWGICGQRTPPFDDLCPPVPDGQFPVSNLDEFAKTLEVDGPDADQTQAALTQLLEQIGQAVLIAHSAAGPIAWNAVENTPDLVAGAVAYESTGCNANDAGQYTAGDIAFLSVYGNADERVEGGGHPGRRDGCAALAQAITDGGGSGTAYDLAIDFGLPGHSHMYAQDIGNEKIAKIISTWIKDEIK